MSDKFEQWCIVELFGHSVIAGLVSEQVIGGQSFLRVDVPEVGETKAFTKYYGSGAIYCMTPCEKETAIIAVESLRVKPVQLYILNLPSRSALPDPDGDEFDSGDEMDDDEEKQ
jgi:hypothetical protein